MSITVSGLFTYPLKSAGRVSHESIEVTARGLRGDRLYMVVDRGTGRFITQRDRDCAKLAVVKVGYLSSGELQLRVGENRFNLQDMNIQPSGLRKAFEATLHQDTVATWDCGPRASEWMSDYLGRDVRIVQMDNKRRRYPELKFRGSGDVTSLADNFPILVTSNASLQDLGAPESVGMDRFRSNIVLDGLGPWEEDGIAALRINGVDIALRKDCTRCIIPSIDQTTGVRDVDGDPTPALRAKRFGKEGGLGGLAGLFFGVNASPTNTGVIHVGDKVEIIARRTVHPAVAVTKRNDLSI